MDQQQTEVPDAKLQEISHQTAAFSALHLEEIGCE
jgi:hypothetical protein